LRYYISPAAHKTTAGYSRNLLPGRERPDLMADIQDV
jgi:hypothetical protein